MFIQVKLLNGFAQPLWYKSSPALRPNLQEGSIVQVPLRNKIVPAVIMLSQTHAPITSFALKEIAGIEPFPADEKYQQFTKKMCGYYQLEPHYFIKRVKQFVQQKKSEAPPPLASPAQLNIAHHVALTAAQHTIVAHVRPAIANGTYAPTVIHGVTGSGKTEVYKELIIHTIGLGKSVILLLPEVTLATAFIHRLKRELPPHIMLCGFHSAATPKEKKLLWQEILAEKPIVIVGVHLPIFLPIANLGLIIVDEEHDVGFQEKKHPKINSKDAAIWRAHEYQIPIVLGSATPSISTLFNVEKQGWKLFHLYERFGGAFPTIKTVLLTDKKQRKNFWISQQLQEAIADRLSKKEQIIIFLNRRGYSFFVQCKRCSFIFMCNACSVSLTLHENNTLTCHYCGFHQAMPSSCNSCHAPADELLKKGIGTQQVVSILRTLFPKARIARADMDTTTQKKEWQNTVSNFDAGDIDIIVGTQTITKGYDFARVTLVGILWADLNLHFPLYNAAETTLQQLIQVAGRAGRRKQDSLVIVQAMSEHTIFQYLNEIDYPRFYEHELAIRNAVGYPPCMRLSYIELKHADSAIVEQEAAHIAKILASKAALMPQSTILGPTQPAVHKIKHTHTRLLYLKTALVGQAIMLYQSVDHNLYQSDIFFVPNPLS